MEFKKVIAVNLNDEVKVKLTKEGIQELARQHKDLREHIIKIGGNDIGEFILRLDDKGFYHIQLWTLINEFKKCIGLGEKPMFEDANIYIDKPNNAREVV